MLSVLAVIAFRKIPDYHQRLMAYAALSLMLPAFARVAYIFDLPEFAAPLLIWFVQKLSG